MNPLSRFSRPSFSSRAGPRSAKAPDVGPAWSRARSGARRPGRARGPRTRTADGNPGAVSMRIPARLRRSREGSRRPAVSAPGRRRRDGAIPLEIDGVVRGYAWRPPRGSRPLYVSVGHGLSLDAALRIVRETTRDRHPEPLRIADLLAKKRKDVKNGKGGS